MIGKGAFELSKVAALASPWPIKMLKMGPAMVAVTPISPKPFLVIAVSALMSPKLLPQASTVSDRRACGSLVMKPKMMMVKLLVTKELTSMLIWWVKSNRLKTR